MLPPVEEFFSTTNFRFRILTEFSLVRFRCKFLVQFNSLEFHSTPAAAEKPASTTVCAFCCFVPNQLSTLKMSKSKESTKRRAQRTTSNIFAMFTQNQIAEFKEAFGFMDSDKDGLISKNDLRATWDALGRIMNDADLQSMLDEAPGALNFTVFLAIFGDRIMGGGDDPDVVRAAFKTFDPEETGFVNEEELRTQLKTFGEKFTDEELDDALADAKVDKQGRFNIDTYVRMITGSSKDEEEVTA